jgi:hypothetical protein
MPRFTPRSMPTSSSPLYTYGAVALLQVAVLGAALTAVAGSRGGPAAAAPVAVAAPVAATAARLVPQVRVIAEVARPLAATSLVRKPVASAPRRTAVTSSRAVARPVARPAPAVRRAAVRKVAASSWSAVFSSSVARIPGYPAGAATWVVSDRYGSWGTADWYRGVVYISPRVPVDRLYDVVVHEWSHLLSAAAYGGDVDAAMAAMNGWFGGSGVVGAERAADCMALALGARWTHYTSCGSGQWRAGAARLVKGEQL